ncbi:MAG: type II toxin-antitoxin system PemK/MazF family toxin [Devosia sp.]|nr:type II toxin-antitoxin system PemK/MazF family toxin [Devosia sp.]
MRRGDLITVAVRGDYGKPRPAVVLQSDRFADIGSVTVALLTGSLLRDVPLLRVRVEPSEANGLRKPSHVMIDRVTTLPQEQVGAVFGRLDSDTLTTVSRHLTVFLGLDS